MKQSFLSRRTLHAETQRGDFMKHCVVGVVEKGELKPFTMENLQQPTCVLRVTSPVSESNNFDVEVGPSQKLEEIGTVQVYDFPEGALAPGLGRRFIFAELRVDTAGGPPILQIDMAEKLC